MQTRSKILMVSGLALLVPALLLAQAAEKHLGLGHGRGLVRHIVHELDLTPDQVQKVKAVLADHKAELKTELTAIQTSRGQLFDAIHADTVDEGAIRAAATGVGKAEADLAVTRAKILAEVRQDLTPEQKEKAKELLGKARSLRNRFFSHIESHLEDPLDGI